VVSERGCRTVDGVRHRRDRIDRRRQRRGDGIGGSADESARLICDRLHHIADDSAGLIRQRLRHTGDAAG
jgi:hypothetical protein